jgi:hypothetical protein
VQVAGKAKDSQVLGKGPSRLETLAKQLKSGKIPETAEPKPLAEIVSTRSSKLAESLKVADTRDKEVHKERLREKRREEKTKYRQQAMKYTGYTLGTGSGDEGEADDVIEESDDELPEGGVSDAVPESKPVDLETAALILLRKKQRLV